MLGGATVEECVFLQNHIAVILISLLFTESNDMDCSLRRLFSTWVCKPNSMWDEIGIIIMIKNLVLYSAVPFQCALHKTLNK